MAWTWHAVDLRTGKRGPQLLVKTRGTVSRIIGESTDMQAEFLCWDNELGKPVPEWRYWTQPGRMGMVLVDDDDRPMWCGAILRRIPNETEWVPVALATLEHYFDRRYRGTKTYTGVDQAMIAYDFILYIVLSAGIPFTAIVQNTGVLRDRTYLDSEDKTILSLLQDLMNIQNGIEFTVDLWWTDTTNTVLNFNVFIGPRVGKSLPEPARFEHPGPVQRFNIPEDYTRENGANDVMAYSSGEGDARPQSVHKVDEAKIAGGWPRYEYRWTPSTSITDIATLDAYAAEGLAQKTDGLTEITLVADLDTAPRLNADWWLGDDITAAITAPAFPPVQDTDGTWQPGYQQRVRVVGWTIDLDARTLTPSLREY